MRDIVYKEKLSTFNNQVDEGIISDILKNKLKEKGIGVNASQLRAFDDLTVLSNVFNSNKFNQDNYCAIEYVIFSSNKHRIDFMLSGYDENNNANIVILELKMWSNENVTLIPDSKNLMALVSRDVYKETNHPSNQALGYKKLFQNFYKVVEDKPILIHAASFLHNYRDTPNAAIKDNRFKEDLIETPTFLKTDNSKLRDFVKRYLSKPDDGSIFDCLDGSEIVPTTQLKRSVNDLILNNDRLALFDAQEVVFNAIVAEVKHNLVNNNKSVIIVRGGPGTGKSVVALKVLGTITNELNTNCFYISQNSSVRNLFTNVISNNENKKDLDNLITWSGNWVKEIRQDNELGCVVVDEAHRLTTSAQGARAKGITIIEEIIKSSKVSVFFIDEDQFITYKDKGTIKNIKEASKKLGAKYIDKDEFILDTQFRCNGSDGYIAFIDYLLLKRVPSSSSLRFNYDFKVISSGKQLYDEMLNKKMNGYFARLLAGYAYNWDKESDVFDVTPLSLNWNKDTRTWATRDDSFNEVGCVFSAQGVEFDYIGVVIGLDLKLKNNEVTVDVEKHAKSDTTYMSKDFKRTPENIAKAKQLIINAYKVLLTRGLKGCYIYCEDPSLSEFINKEWQRFKNKYTK